MSASEITTEKGRKVIVHEDGDDGLRIVVDGGPHSVRYDQAPYSGSDGGPAVVLKLGAPLARSRGSKPTT